MSKRNGNAGLKALAAIMSGLFILLAVAGVVAYFSDWFTNWDKFKTEREEPTEETADGGMLIGESEGVGVSLLSEKIAKADYAANGVSPLAESAYTLTATITPSYAVDKTVDWSVAFVAPSSEWATGKTVTDYVTVTPTSDGALTANVECKQAFGAQIKVIVTSRQNTDAKAECILDYAQRITRSSFESSYHTNYSLLVDGNKTFDILPVKSPQIFFRYYGGWDGGDGNNPTTTFSYQYDSVYTVPNTVTESIIEVRASDTLSQNLIKKGLNSLCSDWVSFNILSGVGGLGFTGFSYAGLICMLGGRSLVVGGGFLDLSVYNNFLSAVVETEGVDFMIRITTTLQYGESSVTTYECQFSDSSSGMVAESISMNNSSLVF